MKSDKPIRLSKHAQKQLGARGASEQEIVKAIMSSKWTPAELGRLECRKDFVFDKIWNNRSYKVKQIRPIFAEEQDEIVVVTVYVYYY